MTPKLSALDHLVLTVANVQKIAQWYETVLGMGVEIFHPADGTTRTALKFGTQKINLHQVGAEFDPKAQHPKAGSADLCFLSETSLTDWQDHLGAHDIAIEEGPIARTGATGPILSLYIRDLDGNLLEISNAI